MPLSPEQELVRNAVINQRKSCFLTGCGGTGKSYLTQQLIGELREMWGAYSVGVTATTGIAACLIGGLTVHSFAGVGLGTGSEEEIISKVSKNPYVVRRWLRTKVLVIDEISMMDPDLFDKIEAVARHVRKRPNVPFGGIQLLLVGDFAQLPPVKQDVSFCFEAKTWKRCVPLQVELRTVFRQKNHEFIDMLNSIRVGVCTPEMALRLSQTKDNDIDADGSAVTATQLFTRNVDVDAINKQKLDELPGETLSFKSDDMGKPPHIDAIKKFCLAPETLELRPGAQVMLLTNLRVESGLSNGTRGVFIGQAFKGQQADPVLVVRFETYNGPLVCQVENHCFTIEQNGVVVASRVQYPIKLAYAITIHKSQGMTLSKVRLSLKNTFECGQAYVALSRVTDLSGLQLIDFTPECVRCHRRVIEFYKTLSAQQS